MLRNKYLASLIAVLFFIVVIYNINFFSKRLQPLVKTTSAIPVMKIERITKEVKSPFPVLRDKSQWRRDPFIYNEIELKEKKNLDKNQGKHTVKIVLQGIMKTKDAFYALVNGWVVKRGDIIEGMLVEDITKDGILLRDGSNQKKITLD